METSKSNVPIKKLDFISPKGRDSSFLEVQVSKYLCE